MKTRGRGGVAETVTSSASPLVTEMTTFVDGCAERTIVMSSVPPASVTTLDSSRSETTKSPRSSLVVVTLTVCAGRGSKSSSDSAARTETLTLLSWLPSISGSSTPVTVTVWGVSQLADVKVSCVGEAVASSGSSAFTVNTTSLAGWLTKTTVKSSVPPASVTRVPPSVSVRVKPATSSSSFVTERD